MTILQTKLLMTGMRIRPLAGSSLNKSFLDSAHMIKAPQPADFHHFLILVIFFKPLIINICTWYETSIYFYGGSFLLSLW